MRHKLQQMNCREMMVAGTICLLLLVTACYFYFGQQKSIKKKIHQGLPLVKVRLSRGRI